MDIWNLIIPDLVSHDKKVALEIEKELKNKMDPDETKWNRTTLLHNAVKFGLLETAKVLLKYGANPECKDDWLNTPMNLVCPDFPFAYEIVETLISYGANINSQDLYGETLLHKSMWYADHKFVNFLISKGARAGMTTIFGYTDMGEYRAKRYNIKFGI